jgi:predicted metalloendopeptidase
MYVFLKHHIRFDDQGRQYDGNGNLSNWWSDSSLKNFEERATCLVNQYSKFTVGGNHVNGQLTLGENIADNGGLKLSYLAWQLHEQKHGVDQQIDPEISNEQLFFYGFAQGWCSLRRDAYAQQLLANDPHSPPNARVNGPVSNSKFFQQAFKCKTGSPMAPADKDRCLLW